MKQVYDAPVGLLFFASGFSHPLADTEKMSWIKFHDAEREKMIQNTPSIDLLSRNIFSVEKWRDDFHLLIRGKRLSRKTSRHFELIYVGGLEEQRCFLLTTNEKSDITVSALPEKGSNSSQINVSAESLNWKIKQKTSDKEAWKGLKSSSLASLAWILKFELGIIRMTRTVCEEKGRENIL